MAERLDTEVEPATLSSIREEKLGDHRVVRADLPPLQTESPPSANLNDSSGETTSEPATTAPAESPTLSADDPLAAVRQALERAEIFNRRHPDFVCRMTRAERLHGSMRSPEVMLLRFRQQPRSVYLTWLDESNTGRECLFVEGKNRGKMISRGGRGDLLLAGKTLWLDPNGSLARSKSVLSITETGLDVICGRIRKRLDHLEKGDSSLGTLSYESGPDPDVPERVYDWIVHQSPPGVDHDLSSGGEHRYGFRRDNGRLELVKAINLRGQIAYSMLFDRLIPVTNYTDTDFDPDALFPRKEAKRDLSPAEKTVLVDESTKHQ